MIYDAKDITAYEDLSFEKRNAVVALMNKGKSFSAAIKEVSKKKKAKALSAKEKRAIYEGLGMKKVRGALGGTYYE